MTVTQNLEDHKIGDTLIQPWHFVNDSDGEPIPQAGRRYIFTLKLNPGVADEEAVLYLDHTVPAGPEADDGLLSIRVEKSQTSTLKPVSYHYELKEIMAGGEEDTEITLFDGKIRLGY